MVGCSHSWTLVWLKNGPEPLRYLILRIPEDWRNSGEVVHFPFCYECLGAGRGKLAWLVLRQGLFVVCDLLHSAQEIENSVPVFARSAPVASL